MSDPLTFIIRARAFLGFQALANADISPRTSDQADINIFTVASGLLYEVVPVLYFPGEVLTSHFAPSVLLPS